MGATLSHLFPPYPAFTEEQLPDLTGKVYFVTGPTSGLGFHLASLLYSRNATVYLAARSAAKLSTAVDGLRSTNPSSKGQLHPVELDLCSYGSIKAAAQTLLSESTRLDVLFHNAGILAPPKGTENAHGVEVQTGVHCVGPYLLTKLLEERLRQTASRGDTGPGDVRVVWVGSMGVTLTPKGGLDVEQLRDGTFAELGTIQQYNASKVGEYFLCGYFAQKLREDGVLNIFLDPGNLKTELQRTFASEVSRVGYSILSLLLQDPVKGAYTELFAGLSPEVTPEAMADVGTWVLPFGRLAQMRPDLAEACRREAAGGKDFVAWCEEQVASGGYPE